MELEWSKANEHILDLRRMYRNSDTTASRLMGWVTPLGGAGIEIHYRNGGLWMKLGPYASLDEAKAALIAVVVLEGSS